MLPAKHHQNIRPIPAKHSTENLLRQLCDIFPTAYEPNKILFGSYQIENYHYDRFPFNLKPNEILFGSYQKENYHYDHFLTCWLL